MSWFDYLWHLKCKDYLLCLKVLQQKSTETMLYSKKVFFSPTCVISFSPYEFYFAYSKAGKINSTAYSNT